MFAGPWSVVSPIHMLDRRRDLGVDIRGSGQ